MAFDDKGPVFIQIVILSHPLCGVFGRIHGSSPPTTAHRTVNTRTGRMEAPIVKQDKEQGGEQTGAKEGVKLTALPGDIRHFYPKLTR